jgi:hypothetical protein
MRSENHPAAAERPIKARDRILEAAALRFAGGSYDSVSLRDIAADAACALAGRAISRSPATGGEATGLGIIARSTLSQLAQPIIIDYIARDFVAPLAARLGEDGERLAALRVGAALLRDELRLPPVMEAAGRPLEERLASGIEILIGEGYRRRAPNDL